jgi:hypothetical protein
MVELTVASSYSYSFDSEDEDAEYDEDVVFYEYKRQLASRNKVDAIVISTCYLDRLTLGNIKELNVSAIIEDDVIVFDGGFEEFYDIFKNKTLQGLVFKNTEAIDTIHLIRKLGEINYCAHCDVPNITELIWYTLGEKTVLYVSIDTESG